MTTIGSVASREAVARSEVTLASDWQRANLKVVAFVQERASGHIVAAAAIPVSPAATAGTSDRAESVSSRNTLRVLLLP